MRGGRIKATRRGKRLRYEDICFQEAGGLGKTVGWLLP